MNDIRQITEDGKLALMETLGDYGKMKKMLYISVVNTEKEEALLSLVPHKRIADLSIIANMELDAEWFEAPGADKAAMIVTYTALKDPVVDPGRVIADAVANSANIRPAMPLASINSLIGDEAGGGDVPLYIVTNSLAYKGAAALFYPGAMKKYAEILGGGYFILPSSIHEVFLMPYGRGHSRKGLKNIVEAVNREEVDTKDFLSNNVYYYNPEDDTFNIAEEY